MMNVPPRGGVDPRVRVLWSFPLISCLYKEFVMRLRDIGTATLLILSLALAAPRGAPAGFAAIATNFGPVAAPPGAPDPSLTGTTISISGTNFPTNFGPQTVPLDGGTHLINNGTVSLTETITPAGSAEWVDLNFKTVNGGPIGGNPNLSWRIDPTFQFATPVTLNGHYDYWTLNGTSVGPIFPFGVFTNVQPNPINPALGDVYLATYTSPPLTSFDNFVFITPYSFSSVGGMDPATDNDFHNGLLVSGVSTIPEPSSLILCGIAVVLGLGYAWRRHWRATIAS